ncbi:MAG: hypothetical protein P4M00_14455 [Azospirillaceae bacterium]|nr:hypothetical protein [Azospirillaceae bacterium]
MNGRPDGRIQSSTIAAAGQNTNSFFAADHGSITSVKRSLLPFPTITGGALPFPSIADSDRWRPSTRSLSVYLIAALSQQHAAPSTQGSVPASGFCYDPLHFTGAASNRR